MTPGALAEHDNYARCLHRAAQGNNRWRLFCFVRQSKPAVEIGCWNCVDAYEITNDFIVGFVLPK